MDVGSFVATPEAVRVASTPTPNGRPGFARSEGTALDSEQGRRAGRYAEPILVPESLELSHGPATDDYRRPAAADELTQLTQELGFDG